jgi:hypothetical protein
VINEASMVSAGLSLSDGLAGTYRATGSRRLARWIWRGGHSLNETGKGGKGCNGAFRNATKTRVIRRNPCGRAGFETRKTGVTYRHAIGLDFY